MNPANIRLHDLIRQLNEAPAKFDIHESKRLQSAHSVINSISKTYESIAPQLNPNGSNVTSQDINKYSPQTQAKMQEMKTRSITKRFGKKLLHKLLAKKFGPGASFDAFMRIQVGRSLLYHLSEHWPCNFMKSLQHIEYMAKNSASDSLCFVGKIRISKSVSRSYPHQGALQTLIHEYFEKQPYHVFVKIVPAYEILGSKFKEIEPFLYEHVVNNMVINHLSPHFMMYLTKSSGPLVKELDRNLHHTKANDLMNRLLTTFPAANHTTMFHTLVLETSPSSQTLNDFLKKLRNDLDRRNIIGYCQTLRSLLLILFQLFYTLAVMDDQQVTHYDLHLDNIFVHETLKPPQKTDSAVYIINEKTFVTANDTMAHIRIFDWDYGYEAKSAQQLPEAAKASRNEFVCRRWGICDTHNPWFDLHKVIRLITQYRILPSELIYFLNTVYLFPEHEDPNMNPLQRHAFRCYHNCRPDNLCQITLEEGKDQMCNGALQNRNIMMTPLAFLESYVDFLMESADVMKQSVVDLFAAKDKWRRELPEIIPRQYFCRRNLMKQEKVRFDPNYLPYDLSWPNSHQTFSPQKNLWNNKVFARNVQLRNHVHDMLRTRILEPVKFS